MNEITFPISRRMRGQTVADLQDTLRFLLERHALYADDAAAAEEIAHVLRHERAEQAYGVATARLVRRFQEERQLQPSSEVDEATAQALNNALQELGAFAAPIAYRVQGRVASQRSAAVDGLRVVLVDKAIGGDVTLTESSTDVRGGYQATFHDEDIRRRGKEKPDLQARIFSGERFLAASEVRYDASSQETLNVLLDDQTSASLRSEYDTLTAALSRHFSGRLGELQETDQREDITYLANKSGWDARAIALAALADQFSQRTAANDRRGVEPAFFYALFRSGISANEAVLYRTDPETVARIWNRAIEQNIIPQGLADRLPRAVGQFRVLSAQQLLDGPALAGASSLKDLLALSLGDDAGQQRRLVDLYARHGRNRQQFWREARSALGEATVDRLQLDGQLAYLTLNNAALIQKLHAAARENRLSDSSQLVTQGYYRAKRWRDVIGDVPVPPEIPGRDDGEKRERYAELLAAQLRLSFPTKVVAQMVRSGETPVASAEVRTRVADFLTQHAEKFEIGMQPVSQYIARLNLDVDAEVMREMTRIERVHQIAPDDDSMNALLEKGIDSAYAAVRYDREGFVRIFKDAVGGEQNAALIHAKAQQVHESVVNLALTFLTARSAPGIGVHSPPSIVDPAPSPPANASDVIAYSTLESLFGEMDYCACEHCRSILSPAAYLVDLLLVIDRPADEVPDGFASPLSVLLDRRPDIQDLQLTCDNTNTPLPYVDLVNETLEHYITNGLSLDGYVGHNTDGRIAPEELLASPQFVSETAYRTLAEETFPPPLPFHQPLENLRRYLRRFDAPLAEVMEALRKNDDLERGSAADYGWRDIWVETLELSRIEHRLLTECWLSGGEIDLMLTIKHLYGFDPSTADADVRAVLDNAKFLCRRVGITYEQLVEILRTRFVNPHSHLIPRLQRLGVAFADLKALKDGTIADAEFDALLAPGLDPVQYGGDIKAWVKDYGNYGRIMSLLTLSNPVDPEDVCSFEKVELRYTDPDVHTNRLRPFEFVRIIRFIRVWKKLGWSIEHTDKALTSLYPRTQTPEVTDDAANLARLDAGFLVLLPRLGVVKRVMNLLGLSPKKDLLHLLACFAPIDTHGDAALYRQMFHRPFPGNDAFAEDGYGNYLRNESMKVRGHAEALRAAFSLTGGEFGEIVDALHFDAATPLTVANISAIFRRGWLARKLKLSVREFLLLTELTGYDPFEVPDPVNAQILRLIGLVSVLRDRDLKPVQALYLIWNQDLSGKSAPTDAEITGFASSLRNALIAIESEYTVVDDPDGSIARARMALVYGSSASDFFFGLLDYTYVTAVKYSHDQPALQQAVLDTAPGRIAYDDFRKQISYTGVLTSAAREALKTVAGVAAAFRTAVDELYAENQKVVGPFFARYPELLPQYDSYVASTDPVETKRTSLLKSFLPELKRRRKRQQALQSTAAATESDLRLAAALLDDPNVLHAEGDGSRPALADFTALESMGLAADYYFAATAVGNPDLRRAAEPDLQYAGSMTKTLPANATTPGDAISGVWRGHLEAPENGFFNVRIETEVGSAVSLVLDGETVALAQSGGTWSNAAPIELRAGTLYAIALKVENVKSELAVRWQTIGRGWQIIPAPYLYSATYMANLRHAYVRYRKAVALAAALKLTAAEMAHLAADTDYQVGGQRWLNCLPVTGSPERVTAVALCEILAGLLDFSCMKADFSAGDERLLDVIRDPAGAQADAGSLLYVVTRWEKPSVDALLARFGWTAADLAHVKRCRRIYDAYCWVKKLGIPAASLIKATTNEPNASAVHDLQAALRARYEESSWLEVLRPMNDQMRTLQRDALVAYILHRMRSHPGSEHIGSAEKLFEYFLMDVQMEPCMLTSRVRHALSTVQLFIERCLMNLEPDVSPSSINAKQWEWMKRYRVWEANRKVFLYPENWLEPELRDDQSPFFKEVMSELLQGEITEDRAAHALLGYLAKLEEVAKLEVCGLHYEQKEAGMADDVTHVVARTAGGANRKYFCRRREGGSWTPWEKIGLDIEDDPVLPIVWKSRLFLFWLKIVQETEQGALPAPTGDLGTVKASDIAPTRTPRITVKVILNWSEYFDDKWQPSRTSDPMDPLLLGSFDVRGSKAFVRSDLKLSAMFWTNGGLRIIVSNRVGTGSSFFLYNAFSTPVPRQSKKGPHFPLKRSLDTTTGLLKVAYAGTGAAHPVLLNEVADQTVEPHHPLTGNPWDAPFFYQDSNHAFFVTTDHQLVRVSRWNDIAIMPTHQQPVADIAGLVLHHDKFALAEESVAVTKQPGFGVVDPSLIDYYVTEDAHIGAAIGTPGTVQYGSREIGPSGSRIRTGGIH